MLGHLVARNREQRRHSESAADPPGVFISYRRTDSSGYASWLAHELRRHFPAIAIFQDIAIEAGANWIAAIDSALTSSVAQLVVIGPHWLAVESDKGGRRLDDAQDPIRREITAALERRVRVIPLLVSGASMPAAEDLPSDLRAIAELQAHELRDSSWAYDIESLAKSLQRIPELNEPLLRRAWRVGRRPMIYLAVASAIGLLAWRLAVPTLARISLNEMGISYTAEAFAEACTSEDMLVLELFLKSGIDPNSSGSGDWTPLERAVAAGRRGVVQRLLASGADPGVGLYRAAARGYGEIVEILLEHGADIRAATRENFNGRWAFSFGSPLAVAIAHTHLDVAMRLLERGAPVVSEPRTRTPLMAAAAMGDGQLIRLLIEKGADPNAGDPGCWTPLHYAVHELRLEATKTLLAAGADPNAQPCDADPSGRSPSLPGLLLERKVMKYSLSSYPVGIGPIASLEDRRATVPVLLEVLLKNGANANTPVGAFNRVPIQHALMNLYSKDALEFVVKSLLAHGADPNAVDEKGKTVLMYAAANDHSAAVIPALVEAGADVNARAPRGASALSHAIESYSEDAVHTLLDAGAQVDPDALLVLTGSSTVASRLKQRSSYREKSLSFDLESSLIERGARADVVDTLGRTVLMRALDSSPTYESDLDLHLAALIRYLIGKGADVRATVREGTQKGWTALMFAAQIDAVRSAGALLEAGATLDRRNVDGETALDIADKEGSTRVARLLRSNSGP